MRVELGEVYPIATQPTEERPGQTHKAPERPPQASTRAVDFQAGGSLDGVHRQPRDAPGEFSGRPRGELAQLTPPRHATGPAAGRRRQQ